ncbi:LTA synthase family protein [Crocinitomix catalasitica]|uniref:LTA synthase family protein n=1 Tax=Crocinitomix catalasitica TaxID=184607 RepID=UPI000483FA8A|nr:LTA synthase family protein [Crocinitomix catalasitica]
MFNNNLFPVVYFTDFLAGFWFDLVTAAIVCLPLVAIEMFPNKWRNSKVYKQIIFYSFNIILFLTVLMNLIDIEYFRHTSSRSTSSLFKMLGFGNDLSQQLPGFLSEFWYLLIFLVLIQILGIFIYKRITRLKDDSSEVSWIKQIVFFLLSATICVLIGRGGVGLKPIAAPNAAKYTIDQNVQLILNSAFTVIKTWGDVSLDEKNYFSEKELRERFTPIHNEEPIAVLDKPNIVLILLESFSVEYISSINGEEAQYTPFLDSLIDEGLVFTNCYANGKKSVDAAPSIISSIPKLMEIEYLTSSYAANTISSLPKILKEQGYSSGFYHSATNGSMNFDVFSEVSGFDKYYGRSEYNNEADFDGTWGIFDEPFLEWSVDQISAMKKPFFSTIFTISSHPPYTIPEKYGDKFSKGPTQMHDAVRYADHSLAQFFQKAKEKDWYDNTLFVIVADHTPASSTPIYYKEMGNMHIPLVFFHPNQDFFKGRNDKIVSQADIMPSLLSIIGYQNPYFAFGNSVFSKQPGYSASFIGDRFLYFGTFENEHYLLTFQNEEVLSLYSLDDALQTLNLAGNKTAARVELTDQLKALIQTYNHSLINNEMTIK